MRLIPRIMRQFKFYSSKYIQKIIKYASKGLLRMKKTSNWVSSQFSLSKMSWPCKNYKKGLDKNFKKKIERLVIWEKIYFTRNKLLFRSLSKWDLIKIVLRSVSKVLALSSKPKWLFLPMRMILKKFLKKKCKYSSKHFLERLLPWM